MWCVKPAFHAFFQYRVQNTLHLDTVTGVIVNFTTPQMQIKNAVQLPALDRMVQYYHVIWLLFIF